MGNFYLQLVPLLLLLCFDYSSCATCEQGWSYHNGYCYLSSLYQPNSNVNWFDAQIECRKKGADIASIKNDGENHFIYKLTRCSNTWNGLVLTNHASRAKHHAWQWIDTNDQGYINWYASFPSSSSSYSYANCVYISTGHKEKWIQGQCGNFKSYYVCKKQATGTVTGTNATSTNPNKVQGLCKRNWYMLGGKCYHINTTRVDFFAALLHCQAQNAKVVTIHGTKDNADLNRIFNDCDTPWLGLENVDPNKVGTNAGWKWNDNTGVDYSNWESINPTADQKKQCATLERGSMWRNRNCWELHPFVCEGPIPDSV